MAAIGAVALTLAACGGGGGAADPVPTPPVVVVPPTEVPADTGASTGPALAMDADSFFFQPAAALAADGAIDGVSGGKSFFAGWNPSTAPEVLAPGMKVLFWGAAADCAAGTEGKVVTVGDTRLSQVAALAGLGATAAGSKLRWTPSADSEGCDASIKSSTAASAVFLNADDASGAMGLLTSSGTQDDGTVPFFGPFTAAGQEGSGKNKFITGSFVNFRQAWWAADPLQPWIGSASARVRSVQAVGVAAAPGAAGVESQVKQQMMATFLNPTCLSELKSRICQMNYMLNTNIVRNGVSDWSKVNWFQKGSVWYDAVQGGLPIIEGPVLASGGVTTDGTSGLELFRSQGSATQHGVFSSRTFDVTISFEALVNVMRITTARELAVEPGAVSDAQLAAAWGSRWNDRSAWVFLSADVAQEVSNPDNSYKVQIAGGFKNLYVGPQH